ncbi:MAG: hypothetical protein A2V86_06210 [Deltaproteobacteria bacterium RBG_16_49_23]|nr:MAG: hypothetical protein A2V86_06210 [Deltaproteobacteria bacterium RBG_16_49_23]
MGGEGERKVTIDRIKRVLVVGAGTMGHSIAMVFAQGGYEVDLADNNEDSLRQSLKLIRFNLRTLKDAKMIDSGSIPKILGRIHTSTSLDAAKEADLVIEAISEIPEAKKELFRALDRLCPARTIFTSNTSYFNIFQLAKRVRPGKMLICHWYAPPHLIPLVDLVRGPRTSDMTIKTVKGILLKLGKTPVEIKKFIAGYIVNRLQRAMAREIFYLLDEGYATAEEIDRAVKSSLGIRIPVVGVVQRYDFTGLDLSLTIDRNPSIHLVSKDRRPKTLTRLVEKGYLGVKSGRGFYDYTSKNIADVLKERDKKLIKLQKFLIKEKF